MTEDEGELIWRLGNEYYHDFGKMVAIYLSKVPPHLQQEVLDMIMEKSNVYSSCYEDYLKK